MYLSHCVKISQSNFCHQHSQIRNPVNRHWENKNSEKAIYKNVFGLNTAGLIFPVFELLCNYSSCPIIIQLWSGNWTQTGQGGTYFWDPPPPEVLMSFVVESWSGISVNQLYPQAPTKITKDIFCIIFSFSPLVHEKFL